jgi:hypothetical protein
MFSVRKCKGHELSCKDDGKRRGGRHFHDTRGKDRHWLTSTVVVHCVLIFRLYESCLHLFESLRHSVCELIDRLEF